MHRLVRAAALAAVLAVTATACSGGAASCDSIADDAIAVLQETIDIVDNFSQDELQEFATAGDGAPEAFIDVQRRGDELVGDAEAAGCSDEEITELLVTKSDQLSADTDFGLFVVETLRTGAFFSNE